MVSKEELKRKYDMLTDAWKLYKKYADVKEDDEYWKSVADESRQISKKYCNDKFAISLLVAVINELNRTYKEMNVDADRAV